jgi:membrane protein required for colicin V production
MTPFDVIALLILVVSAGVGFVRGGVREMVTVVALVVAIIAAAMGLRFTGPVAGKFIHIGLLANAVALLAVFVAVYALLWLAGRALTKQIRQTEVLSGLDRAAGVGFGLVRALVLLGVLYLMFNVATPPERAPAWVKHAALYPLSGAAGHVLMALAPKGAAVAGKVAPALEKAVRAGGEPPSSAAEDDGRGYDAQSRKSVDDLVEKTR